MAYIAGVRACTQTGKDVCADVPAVQQHAGRIHSDPFSSC